MIIFKEFDSLKQKVCELRVMSSQEKCSWKWKQGKQKSSVLIVWTRGKSVKIMNVCILPSNKKTCCLFCFCFLWICCFRFKSKIYFFTKWKKNCNFVFVCVRFSLIFLYLTHRLFAFSRKFISEIMSNLKRQKHAKYTKKMLEYSEKIKYKNELVIFCLFHLFR